MSFLFAHRIRGLLLAALLWTGAGGLQAQTSQASHPDLIRSWDAAAFQRGEQVYGTVCITCHGTPTQEGTLPTSRPFWKEPFKNGSDPHSIYQTLTSGLGQMPAWTVLTPEERYDAVHYIREQFLKPHNPAAYFEVTEEYLERLPRGPLTTVAEPAKESIPPYRRADFGPALFWTIQAEPGNIAYKGIAIRVDAGPDGVSKGRAWMLYDHDTLRAAAGWTGTNFIDWRGIAFDGSHGTHASIVGERRFVNPAEPGWANPETGTFEDPRLLGRDGKPYGPLPREWAHFEGVYYHTNRVVLAYTVGDARILESPGLEMGAFTRVLNISKSSRDLRLRVAPAGTAVSVTSSGGLSLHATNGFHVLRIPASSTPLNVKVLIGHVSGRASTEGERSSTGLLDLSKFVRGAPDRFGPALTTTGKLGSEEGPFAVDEIVPPSDSDNPAHTWNRFTGLDFFEDGDRAALCSWNGDVWIVSGIGGDLKLLTWKRIASGLFQPLGLKIIDGIIHLTCRDQLARLHDLNGDGSIDFVENFNNDHQVTEHFHEFAMGLQTDAEGNFYYAKSARHALPAVVPHHGTLLRISPDGRRTEIVATGFRAANGVCVNDDGTFFVTDQEGHWTPKNRINWVHAGGFYGNMFGYHAHTNTADDSMEQPLVWITNEMDRSPGELLRVTSKGWGSLEGSLLSLSYGTGRIFVVPHQRVGEQMQGGIVPLPIEDFPTGVMRGRFNPSNGHLYACGMYAWAGNRQADGGFYRLRATGKPVLVPIQFQAKRGEIELRFSDPLGAASANRGNFEIKAWSLKRSAEYGSKHFDEHMLSMEKAVLSDDGKAVTLHIPALHPTQGLEIKMNLTAKDGSAFSRTFHGTIHTLE